MGRDNGANRYTPETRERAVRMVLETEGSYRDRSAAIRAIAPKIGCSRESLRRWVAQSEIDSGRRDGVGSDESAPAPNRLRVSDFTYVSTWQGFVHVAFVIDTFANRIVGWRASRFQQTQFVLPSRDIAARCTAGQWMPSNRHFANAAPRRA